MRLIYSVTAMSCANTLEDIKKYNAAYSRMEKKFPEGKSTDIFMIQYYMDQFPVGTVFELKTYSEK
jgi:hypothetical protein